MLSMIRTQPMGSATSNFLDASILLRGVDQNYPDINFSIKTYQKIAKDMRISDQIGDRILLPINLFFETLNIDDQIAIYQTYAFAKKTIATMTIENRRDIQNILQANLHVMVTHHDLGSKMIAFCRTDKFVYPDLDNVGTAPHHSAEKTFQADDYVEITAISLFSKMMVPIWGEFIRQLDIIGISNSQREKMAFDIVEPSLGVGPFSAIYQRLLDTLSRLVTNKREMTDKKTGENGTSTSFIITHNGIDDEMFDGMVMATIIVKRMATYECFSRLEDGKIPNAMVYIDNGIKHTADTRLGMMRYVINTMPHHKLSSNDTEDNSSVIDHVSRSSKKPIDDPVVVETMVQHYEIPRLLIELNTPLDVFNSACTYYAQNPFDISPLCQALVSSFIGLRFGGSKCLGYLKPLLYQKLVVLVQIYLIDQGWLDLAALMSSRSSALPVDSGGNSLSTRVQANYQKSGDYNVCLETFKGFMEKPVNPFLRKTRGKTGDGERVDFPIHITRMAEWLIRYSHSENMATSLWTYAKVEDRPVVGEPCKYDENIIANLCGFYLLFHRGKRPF